MTEKKEYIEREAALRSLFRAPSLSGEQSSDDWTDLILCVARKQIRNVPAADVVEISVLNEWLYEIAINNVGVAIEGDFSTACEEIIARLDGLRAFARERKVQRNDD